MPARLICGGKGGSVQGLKPCWLLATRGAEQQNSDNRQAGHCGYRCNSRVPEVHFRNIDYAA